LLLLLITFQPFPTTLLAEYLLHPEAKLAGAFFSGTLMAIALIFKCVWYYAAKNGRFLARSITIKDLEQITRQHRYGPIAYFTALAVSFVSPGMSLGLCLCLAVFFGFKGWPTRKVDSDR
jgi:uncharacterized membrane protein